MSAVFVAPEVAPYVAAAEAAATESMLLGHRNELAYARAIVVRLTAELEAIAQHPGLFQRVLA